MSDRRSSFTAKLFNGAIAGTVGTCCIFPLDLAKTRLQDQRTVAKAGDKAVVRLYKNVFHCMYVVGRTEGIRGLYKGLGVNLLFVNPEKAIKLAVNDQARQYFGARKGSVLPMQYETIAGGLAGMCQVVVTTPMEFLKIQMQVSGRSTASGGTQPAVSASQVAKNLFREKGIGGLYKGLGATLLRDIPFSCIYFPLFAFLNSKGFGDDGEKPHVVHSLACGMVSGMIASGLITPFDVIKTRLQVLKRMEGEPVYNGIIDAGVNIYRNEGFFAFYKGAVPRMISVAPLFGIAQTVYFFGIAENIMERTSNLAKRKHID